MTSPPPQPGHSTATWDEIESQLELLSQLAQRPISPAEFYAELLQNLTQTLAAAGGMVWLMSPQGLAVQARTGLEDSQLLLDTEQEPAHRQLVQAVLEAGIARVLAPQLRSTDQPLLRNPTPWLRMLGPIHLGTDRLGVVEIFQRPEISPATHEISLQLLAAVCELAADFHRQHRLRELQQRSLRWAELEEFSAQVHGGLDLPRVTGVIANEGRRLIGCDRVMVVVARHHPKVEAVSGAETFDRRGNLIRAAESLAQATGQNTEPLWYHSGDPVPPSLEGALADFLQESQARRLALIPLVREHNVSNLEPGRAIDRPAADGQETDAPPPCGALLLEWMSAGDIDPETRARLSSLTRQAALAVGNIIEHRNLPLFGVVSSLERARWLVRARQLPRLLWGVAAVAGVVAALLLIPADFEIAGQGELQPRIRQHVFAPMDGTVEQLHATHGQQVVAGQPLLVLRNPDLDLEETRILGEIQTTRKKLAVVQAARLESTPETSDARDRYNQLTAEEEELKERSRSLEQQHKILLRQRAGLEVRSPVSGQIVTWEVTQLLESRPVQRGQRLLSIADLDGPWTLELEVPDHDVGHLLEARERLGPDLPVSFVVVTDPQTVHTGTVEFVSLNSVVDEQQQAAARVRVTIDRTQIPLLRPGTTVIPRIYCGRRSLGYVWFHRLIDLIRTRVLF